MLERPDLSDEKITACLRENFHVDPDVIDFLPLGNDANSWVFRVDGQQAAYFLKLKKGPVYPPSLFVPRELRDAGIEQVLAPLPCENGSLSAQADDFNLILYPFIQGRNAMDQGMHAAQWVEFGSTLKRIHACPLPASLITEIQREQFRLNPRLLKIARDLASSVPGKQFSSPSAQELALFWAERAAEIDRILDRAEEIGQMLQGTNLDFVLCHTDIHTANIMLDPQGQLHIIDWDQPLFAPKERDLIFIGGEQSIEEQNFYRGYGLTKLDPLATAYYAYEWVVQEIGDYGERVFITPDFGETTRQDSLRGFKQLFDPGDVVEGAYTADRFLIQNGQNF